MKLYNNNVFVKTPKTTEAYLNKINASSPIQFVVATSGNDECDSLYNEDEDVMIFLPNRNRDIKGLTIVTDYQNEHNNVEINGRESFPVTTVIAYLKSKYTDLLEHPELQPANVQEILESYSLEDMTYDVCAKLTAELRAIGYSIDYGLDAEPFNLRKL